MLSLILNSSRATFEENIYKFKSRPLARGYPKNLIETLLSELNSQKGNRRYEKAQYQPSGPWHLEQNQPSLRKIFKEPPLISYKRGESLKDILVRAKL